MTMMDESNGLRWDSPHGSFRDRGKRRFLLPGLAAAIVLTSIGFAVGVRQATRDVVWDRFDTVKPGVLYRSGQMTPSQLQDAIGRYGIRTVVNFQVRDRTLAQEEALVQSLGLKFVNLPMPGDGFGEESQFRAFLALVDDPANRPVLIHCAAGTCRTGAAVALYRFERDGWSIEDVNSEMQRQAYDTGWLSGYVFNMLKTRPQTTFRDESASGPAKPVPVSESGEPVAANGNASEAEVRK